MDADRQSTAPLGMGRIAPRPASDSSHSPTEIRDEGSHVGPSPFDCGSVAVGQGIAVTRRSKQTGSHTWRGSEGDFDEVETRSGGCAPRAPRLQNCRSFADINCGFSCEPFSRVSFTCWAGNSQETLIFGAHQWYLRYSAPFLRHLDETYPKKCSRNWNSKECTKVQIFSTEVNTRI